MELTKAQREFFQDLDVEAAIKAGEGKLHFEFPHKGHDVFVETYSMSAADLTVRRRIPEGGYLIVDRELSLLNIPDSQNVSGPALLRQLYEAANPPVDMALKDAWRNTPYVRSWEVSQHVSCTSFKTVQDGVLYTLYAAKGPDDAEQTSVELRVAGNLVHTLTLPVVYRSRPTARDLLALADIITQAWREAVC